MVVLDSTVKEQGPWGELRSRTELISKLIHHEVEDPKEPKAPSRDTAVRAQAQAATDALKYSMRQNGDISLYSTSSSLRVGAHLLIIRSILLQKRRSLQHLVDVSLYSIIFDLF